uniref:Collagenase 3 n=1 Tax=Neolamprologus brichardi TaxID=32507 RepID=A0A3Q4HMC7_NEOBR
MSSNRVTLLAVTTKTERLWILVTQGSSARAFLDSTDYLKRFYSLNLGDHRPPVRSVRSASTMEEKIREMQNFFGLKETGNMDPHTLNVMKEARCGVPDVDNFGFYPNRPKWKNHIITYTIARYTPDMKKEDVEKSVRSALKMWSDATPLKFIKLNHRKADIVFSFSPHGDFFPFDGPGGVLAHAFMPGMGMGGDVHFDEDETWTAGTQGYSLLSVAAHELGHSLGLTHSRDPSAIMYPNYRHQSNAKYSLSNDDVMGIQTLYGRPNKKLETQVASKKCDPTFPQLFDAVTLIENEICFFKNRYNVFNSLFFISSQIDAAYDIPAKGVAYIFTGRMKSRAGSIYEYGFSSRVRRVDAAVHVSEYGKTMFFVGEFYYRYDEHNRRMDPGFPRLIRNDWSGVPRRVDAAFKLQGKKKKKKGKKTQELQNVDLSSQLQIEYN